jgi:hypothetical protein
MRWIFLTASRGYHHVAYPQHRLPSPYHTDITYRFGPVMLPIAALFGLAAFSSARTPLGDLVPWMPMVLSIFLLLTAYTLPRFWTHNQGYSAVGNSDEDVSLEEGRSHQYRGSSRPMSGYVQTREHYQSREGSPVIGQYWPPWFRQHQVSHMSRPTSGLSGFASEHDSDIDLHELPLSQQGSPPTEMLYAGLPMRPIWRSRASTEDEEEISSADSQEVHHTSMSGRCESPQESPLSEDNDSNSCFNP